MSESDLRFSLLTTWLRQFFAEEITPTLICGDASFRRYFKFSYNNESFIVSDSPVELVPIMPFITMAKAYKKVGLLVPEIIGFCDKHGFVLQTDVGDTQLLSVLTLDNVSQYYQQALALLMPISQVKLIGEEHAQSHYLADFDDEFVKRELGIFTEWLLGKHLNYSLSETEQQLLAHSFNILTANVAEQPKVGMHRDFHSRNLLLSSKGESSAPLAVIDFQDAVIGPVTYDAVSLLRDCYIRWPDSVINPLIRFHFDLAKQHGLIQHDVTFERYQQWFDLMGIQRHIKAAGIFARLNLRDGKPGYMADIPLTLEYIIDIAAQYSELAPLSQWLAEYILPRVLTNTPMKETLL
ncbi:aminoglycoside phosphotransferase family protein [Shewanella gaetbuli]|uniref:Phosphotransferase n=1 Tax=Shewanella gaetbuli TaxID=220752 RepID=A0A9X1ZTK7_9GAMM|nr:phosphotransferase [Shewanella gaetbuli]MCL1141906.1 phosphotransferase [Shewanella gaetbuli]